MPKENRIKRSLKFSFLEGVFSSSMGGLTSNYFTPYALALKATTAQVGVLAVAPSLATSVAQLLSAKVTDIFKSRKKVISIFVLLNILSFLPVVFVSYLFKDQPVLWLIFFMILYSGFNSLAGPVMSALLAEYIPGDKRGQYFGWRSKALGIITIVVSLAAGFILHFFKKNALQGFLVIFSLALLARFLSWYFINLMYEPPLRLERVSAFNLADFTKNLLKSNFARYTLSISAFHFCVNLAAPFFSLFMLRELKFSYLTYTVIVTTVTAVSILTIERWGRVADKIGNVKVVKFTALLIAVIPFLWIVNHNPLYLFLVQAFSGFVWSGFNLSSGNFIFDAAASQKRIRYIAYFNVLVAFSVFLSGSFGGWVARFLPRLFGYKITSLFLLSSILRFAAIFLFFGKIKEVRVTQAMNNKDLIYSFFKVAK